MQLRHCTIEAKYIHASIMSVIYFLIRVLAKVLLKNIVEVATVV